MRILATIFVVTFFFCSANATNQVNDILIYKNDTLFLYDSPLEQFEDVTKRILSLETEVELSSACWRGYRARWIIKDGILYLSKVTHCHSSKVINNLVEEVLGRNFKDGLMKADWVTDEIWAGKNLVPGGIYIDIFEKEYKFKVAEGKIKDVELISFKACHYQPEDSLYRFIYSNIDWDNIRTDKLKAQLSVYVTTDKFGKVNHAEIESSTNSYFNNEILRVLKLLPCRNVYYNKGEFWDVGETLSLKINKNDKVKYVR